MSLESVCPTASDTVADRVFRDYGAVFLSENASLPPACVMDEMTAAAFQAGLNTQTVTLGGTSITLQSQAMKALIAAVNEAQKKGVKITPRGGSAAAARTYDKTVDLWNSRFQPGLAYWTSKKKITSAAADAAKMMSIHDQVAQVLAWESKGLWFSKDLSKSILYSVAAPGASQHMFLLALDVTEFDDAKVRDIMARHGWFQTVISDLPHFTYLGKKQSDLTKLGLRSQINSGRTFWIPAI